MDKIHFIANSRIPTQRAHGLHIIKMCEAFSDAGADVELILPKRVNELDDDPFEYYKSKKNFRIRKIFTIDWMSSSEPRPPFFSFLQSATFALSVFFYVLRNGLGVTYFRYDRWLMIALLPFLGNRNIVCEAHFLLEGWEKRMLLKCSSIVVVTEAAKNIYRSNLDFNDMVILAPDGVSLEDFFVSLDKTTIRKRLGLSKKKIVMYTGYFYAWKGIDDLILAASYFDLDTELVLVGGADEDTARIRGIIDEKRIHGITIIRHKPYAEMALYQHAADCLVVTGISEREGVPLITSPLKLFEYMASGNPIVASDISSFRDILTDGQNALLAHPGDPQALAGKIKEVLDNPKKAEALARQARKDVLQYTWKSRAKNILSLLRAREAMPKVLYVYAGRRKQFIRAYKEGRMADTQLLGMNYMRSFGICASFLETQVSDFLRKINFHFSQLPLLFAMRNYDVAFIGGHILLVFLAKSVFRMKKPKIVLLNTFFSNALIRNRHGLYGYILRSVIASVDIIVCLSSAQKQFLESEGFDSSRIRFIPLGVDINFFKPCIQKQSDTGFIFSMGKDMGRDYKTLIQAVENLYYKVRIIAAERNFKHISSIPENVDVLYDISQVDTLKFYCDSDFVVVPTIPDGRAGDSDCSGQTVFMEAMASGKAIIATRREYMRDYVENDIEALIVDPEDPQALRCAIQSLLDDPARAHKMGEFARKKIERYFSTREFSRKLSEIFKEVLIKNNG